MALARRGFLFGLFAAPAIVRASSLMPVKLFEPDIITTATINYSHFPNLSEIVTTTLRNRHHELAENFCRNNALVERLKGNYSASLLLGEDRDWLRV